MKPLVFCLLLVGLPHAKAFAADTGRILERSPRE